MGMLTKLEHNLYKYLFFKESIMNYPAGSRGVSKTARCESRFGEYSRSDLILLAAMPLFRAFGLTGEQILIIT